MELSGELEKIKLEEQIFKDIKFYVTGEISDKVITLLKDGGAERMNYFTDYVTHLICGINPEENDLSDANDLYEIPALTPKWICMSARLKKLVNQKPYLYNPNKLFSNCVFCFSKLNEDRNSLWAIVTYNGGKVQLNLDRNCTHLITIATDTAKYSKAMELGPDIIKVATPDWIIESVKNNGFAQIELYHPKLINWPKVTKYESTTAITGFEPPPVETQENLTETNLADSTTQALLDKLKQRMPWNQPQTSQSANDVVPPNVVAPTNTKIPQTPPPSSPTASNAPQLNTHQQQRFFSPTSQQQLIQNPQQHLAQFSNANQIQQSLLTSNNQMPKSIVHHTPQGTIMNQPRPQLDAHQFKQSNQQVLQNVSQAQASQLIQNRLITQQQLQQRQHLLGQIGQINKLSQLTQLNPQNQFSQQVLQQQRAQGRPIGQPTVQQQQQQQQAQPNQIVTINQNQQNLIQRMQLGQLSKNPVSMQQLNQQIQQHFANRQQPNLNITQLSQNNQMQHLNITQQQSTPNQNQGSPYTSVPQSPQSINQVVLSPQNQQNINIQQNKLIQSHFNQNLQQQQILTSQQQIVNLNQLRQKQFSQTQQFNDGNQRTLSGFTQQQQQPQSPQQNQLIQSQQIQNSPQNQLIQIQQQNQQQQSQQQTAQLITTQQQGQLIQNQQSQQQQQQPNQLIQNQQQNQIIQSPQPSQLVQTQQVQFVQAQQFNQNQNIIPQSPQQSNQYAQAQQPQFIQQNQQQQQKFVQNQNQMQSPQQSSQFIQTQQQANQQQQQQSQPQIISQQLNVNQQQQLLINQQQNQSFQQQQTTTTGNQFNQQLQNQLVNTQNIVSQNQIVQQNIPPQLAQQQQQNLVSQQNIPLPAQQQSTIQINQPNLPGQQRPIGQNLWQPVGIRHAASVIHQQGAPRVQWPANHPQGGVIPQRQYIQLDAQTHQQLQQMAPEQRALFIAKLQRQRQLALQQKQQLQLQQHQQHQQQQQQQQRHVVIRVPPGLTPQQQMQWLQQQAKQQGVVLQQASIQQQQAPPVATPNIPQGANVQSPGIQQPQQAPGLSPIQQQQGTPQFTDHAAQQQQLQIQRQQHFRLQQLQVQQQREQQTPKPAPPIPQQEPPVVPPASIARPLAHPQPTETVPVSVVDANVAQQQLVVNAKTKTALANMLSIRLQSGATSVGPVPETIAEPSAAGTLRLMTAQHNAALSSSGRPQDLLGLQQRRPIGGSPSTELVRPPAAPSVPPPAVGEPPKLQYSPRSNIPLQHRAGPFYGHNPNLKLPPDLFLLGCIFVVVEVERFLEESMPNWKQKIEKYGGEVESQYCSRVTHVLCETQRHGVVMQALRDFKRCVTLYWLSDILKRKQVLPPWTALHLPTMYLDTAPASKHLISLSGFVEPERSKIKHMIKYIGATFTSYFSKHNTLLIAAKAEGEKFARAKKWGTPAVNIQWLTDVMLGHFAALNQIEHMKYQQFPTPPVFTFDPALVPTLMQAWKMPINISQESYERVKRCVSPVTMPKKTKKIKTETSNDENENPENFGNPNASQKILFSGCQNIDELHKVVITLNGAIAKTTTECTHLVMSTLQRTNKLLHCLCLSNVHIVPDSWLWDSRNAGKFLDEINYTFDTKEFNSMYKCDFGQTLQTKNRNKLLEGKFFFITPSVYPSKKFLSELVQSCGGVVEKIRRTTSQIEATNISSPYSYIILTHENDLHLVYDVLRNKKNKVKIVCNVELLLSAILKQTFEVEPYAVKVL